MRTHLSVDVVVIGAGITGLSAALELARAGRRVAVLERGEIGQGETSHTSAHLTEIVDGFYPTLISDFGLEGARLATEAGRLAIERIEALCDEFKTTGSDCGFTRVPAFVYADRRVDLDRLTETCEAFKSVGLPATWFEGGHSMLSPLGSFAAVRVDGQAQFHPSRYLVALAHAVLASGGMIYERSPVTEIATEGAWTRVSTDASYVMARDVIVATDSPITRGLSINVPQSLRLTDYRTYVIAAPVGRRFFDPGLYWDLRDPYHYTRTQVIDGETWLLIGGEDHKVGHEPDTEGCFKRLVEYGHARFGIDHFERRWSGQVEEPADGLPYIGRAAFSDHHFVATGYDGNGLTFGTFAGMLLSELVLGARSEGRLSTRFGELFSPSRLSPLASLGNVIAHNVDAARWMIGDHVMGVVETDLSRIPRGEGRIAKVDGEKCALYRDEHGRLSACSAVCPHLGGIVHWNQAETSWDCPCHGSRFTAAGKVLHGPALSDLEPREIGLERAPARKPA